MAVQFICVEPCRVGFGSFEYGLNRHQLAYGLRSKQVAEVIDEVAVNRGESDAEPQIVDLGASIGLRLRSHI